MKTRAAKSKFIYYGLLGGFLLTLPGCFALYEQMSRKTPVAEEKETSVLSLKAPGSTAFRRGAQFGSDAIQLKRQEIAAVDEQIIAAEAEEIVVTELEETALNQNVILKKIKQGLSVPGTIVLTDQKAILGIIETIDGLEESLLNARDLETEKFYNDKIKIQVAELNDFVIKYNL